MEVRKLAFPGFHGLGFLPPAPPDEDSAIKNFLQALDRTILCMYTVGETRGREPPKKEREVARMDEVKNEELEEMKLEETEEMEETRNRNAYTEHVKKLRCRGRKILLRHMEALSVYRALCSVEGATPMAQRILGSNEGSAPETAFRVYCPECGKIRTLLVFPGKYETELRSSCVHLRDEAATAVFRDRRLVYTGRYRVIPAGLAAMLGLKIVG
jgi:hypothetical protein